MASILCLTVCMAAFGGAFANFTRRSWRDQLYSSVPLYHLDPPFKEEKCTDAHEKARYAEIIKSECASPKLAQVRLFASTFLELTPGVVWLKRCIGSCSDEPDTCLPNEVNKIKIPVRVYDGRTNKGSCALFEVEEHVFCECNLASSSSES